MTKPRGEVTPPLRLFVNEQETAAILGIGYEKFAELRGRLEAAGLPKPDPLLGKRPLEAIVSWSRKRWGEEASAATIDSSVDVVRQRLEQRKGKVADKA